MGVADLVKTPAGGLDVRIGVVPVDSARAGGDPRFRAALETLPAAERFAGHAAAGGDEAAARARGRAVSARRPAGGSPKERPARRPGPDPGRVDPRGSARGAGHLRRAERGRAGAERPRPADGDRHAAHRRARARPRGHDARRSIWRARRCATTRGRRPASGCAASCCRAAGSSAPTAEYTLATDDATAAGAGGLAPLAGLVVERAGLIDVEAVAAFLRRLPQPVEANRAVAFVSTRS